MNNHKYLIFCAVIMGSAGCYGMESKDPDTNNNNNNNALVDALKKEEIIEQKIILKSNDECLLQISAGAARYSGTLRNLFFDEDEDRVVEAKLNDAPIIRFDGKTLSIAIAYLEELYKKNYSGAYEKLKELNTTAEGQETVDFLHLALVENSIVRLAEGPLFSGKNGSGRPWSSDWFREFTKDQYVKDHIHEFLTKDEIDEEYFTEGDSLAHATLVNMDLACESKHVVNITARGLITNTSNNYFLTRSVGNYCGVDLWKLNNGSVELICMWHPERSNSEWVSKNGRGSYDVNYYLRDALFTTNGQQVITAHSNGDILVWSVTGENIRSYNQTINWDSGKGIQIVSPCIDSSNVTLQPRADLKNIYNKVVPICGGKTLILAENNSGFQPLKEVWVIDDISVISTYEELKDYLNKLPLAEKVYLKLFSQTEHVWHKESFKWLMPKIAVTVKVRVADIEKQFGKRVARAFVAQFNFDDLNKMFNSYFN